MSILVGRFEFLNFGLGGRWVQIRNQRLRKLPSTKFYLNQITFGILIRLIRSGGPSCPRGLSYSTSRYYPLRKKTIELIIVTIRVQKLLFTVNSSTIRNK